MEENKVREFQAVVQEALKLAFPTRASELQDEMVGRLDDLIDSLSVEKEALLHRSNETGANQVLMLERLAIAIQLKLKMWLSLKREDPEQAWRALVEAQDSIKEAMSIGRQEGVDMVGFDRELEVLEGVEGTVFPPQIFVSMGATVQGYLCSICGKDYEDCEHVSGRAYLGEVCKQRPVGPIELNHVAIVGSPADKRCRVVRWPVGDVMRDVMTWKPVEGQASMTIAVPD